VLVLARALSAREALRGKDLVLRARIGKDGSAVLGYDVLTSPESSVLMLLPPSELGDRRPHQRLQGV